MVIAAGFGINHFRETPSPDPVLHLSVPLPGNALAGFVALSPDGRRLVIWVVTKGNGTLWLRSLDSPQLQPLPNTEHARAPFWSPDSKSLGFFADGKLKIMPAAGGPAQILCDGMLGFAEGTWNREEVILFSTSRIDESLQRVNASGGVCTPVTKPNVGSTQRSPEFLPDGKHFVYMVRGGDEARRGLYLASLDDPTPRRLLADESSAMFASSATGKKYGYLLFRRGSTLMAQPFNVETLQLAGDAIPAAPEVSDSMNPGLIAASVSASGILVYESNPGASRLQLTWRDRSGKELSKLGSIQLLSHVGLSPDEKTAAAVRGTQGIWLYDLQRGGETRFTSPDVPGNAPVWSPEGNWIAFNSGKDIYLKDARGGLKEEVLLENGNGKTASDWAHDGRYLIYTETEPRGRGDIWFLADPLNKSGERKSVKFQGTEARESQGRLSPDGHWLAYVSDESGGYEVYVRPFPSGPGRWKISAGQGINIEPRWRGDGKELFFLESGVPVNRLMAVPVQSGTGVGFRTGAPQVLFEFRAVFSLPEVNHFLYSPSADGQRFLVRAQAGDAEPTLNFVSNWEKAALESK